MCGLFYLNVWNTWKIVQEDKGLDDYGFFVELNRDEIEGGLYYQ
jgi:hypothetical protein